LSEGGYKAAESVGNLQRMLDTVDVIQKRVRSKQPFQPCEILGCCVGDERGTWPKGPTNCHWEIISG
jgi:hypothetical protein